MSPIGCHGWYPREKPSAEFDQQLIDAGAMVEACLTGYHVTHDPGYRNDAMCAMSWFYGSNAHGLLVYDLESGGCHDRLHSTGVNENQGAESTIVHLLAQIAVQSACSLPHMPQGDMPTNDVTAVQIPEES